MKTINFTNWMAACMAGLQDKHDVVINISGSRSNMWGPVGQGKSNLARAVALTLNPATFNIRRDLVVKDDLDGLQRNINDRQMFKVIWVDEARWFLNKQFWSKPYVKVLTPEMETNRKELRIWIFVGSLFGYIEFFREGGRITWNAVMNDRTTFELFVNNGTWDVDMQRYGQSVGLIAGVPLVPGEDTYLELVNAHNCLSRGPKCVVNRK